MKYAYKSFLKKIHTFIPINQNVFQNFGMYFQYFGINFKKIGINFNNFNLRKNYDELKTLFYIN